MLDLALTGSKVITNRLLILKELFIHLSVLKIWLNRRTPLLLDKALKTKADRKDSKHAGTLPCGSLLLTTQFWKDG